MTHTEFASWLKGINTALGGSPPTKELWQQIMDEAAKLAAPTPNPSKPLNDWMREFDEIKKRDISSPRWPAPPAPFYTPTPPRTGDRLWPPYEITCGDKMAATPPLTGALDRGDRDAR